MNSSSLPADLSRAVLAAPVEGPDHSSVVIPDAHFLFHADFKRVGFDLKLTGDDGQHLVVPDYFRHERLPTLFSSDGAALIGDVVAALAGPLAPGQYAQATAPTNDVPLIGRVVSAQGN
ncbi:MAG TPA: hypothetical protein VGJ16_09055, partial [Pirellulales bacterium]